MAINEEIIDYIQLINSENVGPVTFYKLVEKFGTAAKALANLPSKYRLFPRHKAKDELETAHKQNIHIISFDSPLYPEKLAQLNDAPPILYVLGNPDLLNHPLSLSIVGARNASINGRKTASKIAHDLTNNDILIVSGMARGIDTSAHKGAMYAKSQQGPTIAVFGTGVDVIYPRENKDLYEQIRASGAIISEFPLGTKPQINNFPRRNRLVSALSDGTLVVEATLHSGSLITARLALEQGKDIFAIPGSPQDTRSLGPNKLIKEGAVLVEDAFDILEVFKINNNHCIKIAIDKDRSNVAIKKAIEKTEKIDITDYLSPSGTHIDEIIRTSGLDSSEVSLALIELELEGKIERQSGSIVALIR